MTAFAPAAGPGRMTPPAPPAPRQASVETLLEELQDWLTEMRRAKAGYCQFVEVYEWVQAGMPVEQQALGMIRMSFPATVTGRDSETPFLEIRDYDPNQLLWWLIPQINAFSVKLHEAIEEIAIRVQGVKEAMDRKAAEFVSAQTP